ncbi:hypothetical protein OAB47_07745, partial [Vicingaceae bacterium]|nr:hypothetical protein [Vicingaceae bacterium]
MIKRLFFLCIFQTIGSLVFGQASEIDEFSSTSLQLDSTKSYFIKDIVIIGNKKTQDYIISRELSPKTGDTLLGHVLSKEIEQSRKNILNTQLFHYVKVNLITENNQVSIYILVTERWYFFPVPIFEIDDNNINTWLEDIDWKRLNYGAFVTLKNIGGRDETMRITFQL